MGSKRNQPYILLAVGALAATSAFAVFGLRSDSSTIVKPSAALLEMQLASLPTEEKLSALRQLDDVYAELIDAVSPSVVYVDIEDRGQSVGGGSGFIYTSDGWIVTNDHVVAGKEIVDVVLADGRRVEGEVFASGDPQIDLAMVKIDGSGLKPLEIADSDEVRVGVHTIAIGAPFGLSNSVTIGHVSALNREASVADYRARSQRTYSGMIQTDASINPGNSGGPLIDISGRVIGVNSTIQSVSGTSAGVGFAIPSNTVEVVADEIIRTGEFDRGLMGLYPTEVPLYRQKELGIKGGALAETVTMEQGAFKAGMRDGDIILKVDGNKIKNQTDLLRSMYVKSPGEIAQITYLRDGKEKTADVKLADPKVIYAEQFNRERQPETRERPDMFEDLAPEFFRRQRGQEERDDTAPRSGRPILGIDVQTINKALRSQFDIPADVTGVVITDVRSGSIADGEGLRVGDVLTKVDGNPVASAKDVRDAMAEKSWNDKLNIAVQRFDGSSATAIAKDIILR
jgi:serine protease Do